MTTNKSQYLQKAIDAIQDVFNNDYPLLSLPFPDINFLPEEEENFQSGMYYISIGDTWQINLNFGKLPSKYKDFQDEVKVLTRHEIEHYRTCPFNVITHFRMIKTINETNSKELRHQGNMAGSIANQIADVIVDTKNYKKYSKETLKSEIEWIKKGGKGLFKNAPRHNKLMFLLKQSLWKQDLKLHETDGDLLEKVNSLAKEFNVNENINRSNLLDLTKSYTNLFQHLYELDMIDEKKTQKQSTDVLDSISADSDSCQEQNADLESDSIPDKNGGDENGEFLFQESEQIENAVNQLAQESSFEEFCTTLESAGIKQLNENDKKIIWFEQQNIDAIPLEEKISKGSKSEMSYPAPWRIGEPVEDLDLLLSLQISPKIIPGITTLKWEKHLNEIPLDEKKEADLLLVLDRSGSMGKLSDTNSNLHIAVLASFGFVKYFEQKKSEVALISFSNNALIVNWTKEYDLIKENLLLDGGGNTYFPEIQIENLLQKKLVNTVMVIITDGEIVNWKSSLRLFQKILSLGNKIFLFIINNHSITHNYKELERYGGCVENVSSVDDIRDIVFQRIK